MRPSIYQIDPDETAPRSWRLWYSGARSHLLRYHGVLVRRASEPSETAIVTLDKPVSEPNGIVRRYGALIFPIPITWGGRTMLVAVVPFLVGLLAHEYGHVMRAA